MTLDQMIFNRKYWQVTEEKELLMWGRHIMMGYANRQDATRKDMTEDGWLRYKQYLSPF